VRAVGRIFGTRCGAIFTR